ncbi:MAG: tRNA lysidine(34) synthetase TilS [Hyphomicrobiaceae bacterium]
MPAEPELRPSERTPAPRKRPDPPRFGEAELAAIFSDLAPHRHILLAVSGGPDSTALMALARDWQSAGAPGAVEPPALSVATVDHGLRAGSAEEAAAVAALAARLGLSHATLRWDETKPSTGLQAAARTARYRLLAAHARTVGATAIATAHTCDDQAETLLMRLARGSGIDGLAAMSVVSSREGILLVRPLLTIPKARLVAELAVRNLPAIADPSNERTEFERVRIRREQDALERLGLSARALGESARRIGRARHALERIAGEALRAIAEADSLGIVRIDRAALGAHPGEIRLRMLASILAHAGGTATLPELRALEALEALIASGASFRRTLGGCMVLARSRALLVHREPGRMAVVPTRLERGASMEFDARFRLSLSPDAPAALTIGPTTTPWSPALAASAVLPKGTPALALRTLPAVLDGGRAIAMAAPGSTARPGVGEALGLTVVAIAPPWLETATDA